MIFYPNARTAQVGHPARRSRVSWGKVEPRLAPKTGARTWGTHPLTLPPLLALTTPFVQARLFSTEGHP